ncbi:MAG: chloramphenicol-sensitive protein RarD [Desulforhopalus sp.]|jgi:chloramphenicol-sensitive protein RarD
MDVRGVVAAIVAFTLWGVLPVYWKALGTVPAYEILCHRMFWSLVLTLGLIQVRGGMEVFRKALTVRRNRVIYTMSGILLAVNWLLYIWAVNAGFIVEASLGYFIGPLINVFFGMVFFGEEMRRVQWVALFLAFLGVLYLTVYYGKFPWIGLVLAFSFSIYGLLHKKNNIGSLDALCLETGVLFIPAAVVLVGLGVTGNGSFTQFGISHSLLLVGAGVVTTIPLLLFGYAAKRIRLSTLGLFQYLGPSISLVIGVFVYKEDFPLARLIGFSMVWGGLLLFLAENLFRRYTIQRTLLKDRISS